MKTFVYLSVLLLTAGAAFGIIDYAKAKKERLLERVYDADEADIVAEPKEEIVTNNPEKTAKKMEVATNRTEPVKPAKANTKLSPATNKKVMVTKPASKLISPKAPSVEIAESPVVAPTKKVIATPPPPPPPKRISIRDFGRGSLKMKRAPKEKIIVAPKEVEQPD